MQSNVFSYNQSKGKGKRQLAYRKWKRIIEFYDGVRGGFKILLKKTRKVAIDDEYLKTNQNENLS